MQKALSVYHCNQGMYIDNDNSRIRGFPYMTSAQKGEPPERVKKCTNFADKQYRFWDKKTGRGLKKSLNPVDVIY